MQLSTTNQISEKKIVQTIGPVFGEVVEGMNFLRDVGAGIRDIFGGRSQGYEGEIIKAREAALNEMAQHARELGANAVVGVKIDLETIGQMMLIHAQGTAVVIE